MPAAISGQSSVMGCANAAFSSMMHRLPCCILPPARHSTAGQGGLKRMASLDSTAQPSFREAFMVWLKIGCINFGGPAGQIATMHRILVDEKKWIDESRFLHGARGGLAAGILFVLPGALVMLILSLLYAYGRGLGPIDGALFGIKAAVLVIVVEALLRIGRRSLKSALLVGLATLGFIGIFVF